jgi:hypothetical protein
VLAAARLHEGHIRHETLTRELHVGSGLAAADRTEDMMIDDFNVALAVRRLGDGRTLSGPAQPDDL